MGMTRPGRDGRASLHTLRYNAARSMMEETYFAELGRTRCGCAAGVGL